MNIRNMAGIVVLGSFVVACSTQAGGPGTEPEESSTAAQTEPAAKKDETKKDDAKKTDEAPKKELTLPNLGDDDDADADADGDDDDAFPADGDDDDIGGGGIQTTGGGRAASNNDCCFQGEYFECPDTNACFGGFDVNACFASCGADAKCFTDCADQVSNAPPPQGCTKKAPPPNVKCQ